MNGSEVGQPLDGFEGRLEAELVKVVTERGAVPKGPPPRTAWRRPAGLIVVLAGLAAAAAVALPLVLGSGTSQVTLAAYTVLHNSDGSITVNINNLRDPQELQRMLAASGVSARVTVSEIGGPGCRRLDGTPWPTREQVGKIFGTSDLSPGHAFTVYPASVPAGVTVLVQIIRSAHGFNLVLGARQTSVALHWSRCGPDRT